MSKGAKIAIGCFAALFMGGVALLVGFGGLLWWGKGKLEQVAGGVTESMQKIESLEKKANENAFTPPVDGVIAEDRLLKFIEVRKRVYAIYEKHRASFESAGQRKQPDLKDVTGAFGAMTEVKTAQAQALADLGMSTSEYMFMVESVYKSAWAAAVAQANDGKSASQTAEEAMGQVQKQLETATTPEAAQAMKELQAAAEQAKSLDVPKANVELFRRHEEELRKYAMDGLELIGL